MFFALNPALHPYLILAFTKMERVTMDVEFCSAANAAGRILGTVLSGLADQAVGLPLMLGTTAMMVTALACLAGFPRRGPSLLKPIPVLPEPGQLWKRDG